MGTSLNQILAPIKAAQKALQESTIGTLNPNPWIFMTGNCLGWISYAFVKRDYFVLAANAPGFIFSLWLNVVAIKLEYGKAMISNSRIDQVINEYEYIHVEAQRDPTDKVRLEIPEIIVEGLSDVKNDECIEAAIDYPTEQTSSYPHELKLLMIIVVWIMLFSYVCFSDIPITDVEMVIGIAVNINLVFFFGAPLSTVTSVIKMRNSSSIHVPTMIMNTSCSTFWFLYGVTIVDSIIYVPNGLGMMFGVIQIILICLFTRKPIDQCGPDSMT